MIEFKRNEEATGYFDQVDRSARDFFDLDNDPTQINADMETYEYSVKIGGITMSVSEDDKLLGWCFAFPTNKTLMNQFILGEINENQLFWRTEKDDNYDAVYLCAVYVYEGHRNKGLGHKLVRKCLEPLLKDGVCIFYEPYSEEGKRLGVSVLKDYKYEIKIKKHGNNKRIT